MIDFIEWLLGAIIVTAFLCAVGALFGGWGLVLVITGYFILGARY